MLTRCLLTAWPHRARTTSLTATSISTTIRTFTDEESEKRYLKFKKQSPAFETGHPAAEPTHLASAGSTSHSPEKLNLTFLNTTFQGAIFNHLVINRDTQCMEITDDFV